MKFLLDECCSARLVKNLRDAGHDVLYVIEYGKGSTDTEVLRWAYRDSRILITEDKDFGELVYRLKRNVVGIILLRFSTAQKHLKWPRLEELISLKASDLKGKFVVIDKEKFRIRSLL